MWDQLLTGLEKCVTVLGVFNCCGLMVVKRGGGWGGMVGVVGFVVLIGTL